MEQIKIYISLLFLFIAVELHANAIDINKNYKDLVGESSLCLDKEKLQLKEIEQCDFYTPQKRQKLNLGFVKDATLWIKLTLYNNSNKNISKLLQVRNPLLEKVTLYDANKTITKTYLDKKELEELHTTFSITLAPHETRTYYLQVANTTTTLRLGIALKEKLQYLHEDYHEKLIIYIFFTILLMLMFYNFILYLYTKESAYILYTFYLSTLLFQQSTYLGMTQLFFPQWFVYYDNINVLLKVNMLFISAILFARSFLKTTRYKTIDTIYKLFLLLGVIEIPLFGTPYFYYPEVGIITALIFIYFNMYASIYIYKKGFTQARLFILGWSFQLIGFTLMILDGLGVISVMDDMPNIVMFFTSIEAIFLSLAFIDRYSILKKEKELSDAKLFKELQDRQKVIEAAIQKATAQLNTSLENEKNLLKELHHRTKNNLQLILSLIRMQSDKLDAQSKGPCLDLERRINTIAQTQQMLYLNSDLQKIDMAEYISTLCHQLESSTLRDINCQLHIQEGLFMPIKEAGYIGLIINEFLTNSIKYVTKEEVIVTLYFTQEKNHFRLEYRDNSDGFSTKKLEKNTLGLELVRTLVQTQLEGEFVMQHTQKLHYIIEFTL
jgi:two-component sensor histidine kinase